MIGKKTTLILGAGSSSEFGYPLGCQLLTDVRASLKKLGRENDPIMNLLFLRIRSDLILPPNYGLENLLSVYDDFEKVGGPSIDWALDRVLKNYKKKGEARKSEVVEKIVKFLISWRILKDETNVKHRETDSSPHWLKKLIESIKTIKEEELLRTQLKIVTFNYDRTVQYLIRKAINDTFQDEKLSENFIEILNVQHVYGSVGNIKKTQLEEFQNTFGFPESDISKAISLDCHVHFAYHTSKNIFTINEVNHDSSLKHILAAKNSISESDRVIFLGFGFHTDNVRVLDLKKTLLGKEVLSTGFGLANAEKNSIASRVGRKAQHIASVNSIPPQAEIIRAPQKFLLFGKEEQSSAELLDREVSLLENWEHEYRK